MPKKLFSIVLSLTFVISITTTTSLSSPPKQKLKAVAPCTPNMFTLTWFNSMSSYLNETLNTFIRLASSSTDTTNYSFADYINSCFKQITYRVVNKQSGSTLTTNYPPPTNIANNQILHSFSFAYDFYTNSDVVVTYEQNDPFGGEVAGFTKNKTTCFGIPAGTMNYEIVKSVDNSSYLITWTEPSVINAPTICYYTIGVQLENEMNEREFRIDDVGNRRFNLTRDIVPIRSRIQIGAVNVHLCYAQMYPLFGQCSNQLAAKYSTFFYVEGLDPNYKNGAATKIRNFHLSFGVAFFCFYFIR